MCCFRSLEERKSDQCFYGGCEEYSTAWEKVGSVAALQDTRVRLLPEIDRPSCEWLVSVTGLGSMCLKKMHSRCSLVLQDGTILPGESFGAKIPVDGEVGKFLSSFIDLGSHKRLVASTSITPRRLEVYLHALFVLELDGGARPRRF